ncbi:MAG TPA: type I-C CRISPR-associated protein Cas8c/Csd1 [Bacteroidales bacterium]|nr:type I-C CRISPR-associated protein Cas8c/Csd1 [Bacteroidales bacterium]HPS49548.1 type I-C CRISPR-associated protein Cas8c/Csd1 [Bacteroidales bacterium]
MIKELAEFGKRIRKGHDALKDEPISVDLVINEDGSFHSFSVIDKISRPAEAITSKKGKARLLLDKASEVLNYSGFCSNIPENEKSEKQNKAESALQYKHQLFLKKLQLYKELDVLKPVFDFYYDNRENGLDKAFREFENQVGEKDRLGNIAFRIKDDRLHEQQVVYNAIIEKFEIEQAAQLSGQQKVCSICGKSDFPVLDQPHGMIKRVPDGQKAGCALVSYNEKAFESYNLKGNDNSSICTNCAKNYVEGLNWLLANGSENTITDKKGKEKQYFSFTNRKNLGSDTANIYWTREEESIDDIHLLDNPDPGEITKLFDSVSQGDKRTVRGIKPNQFYSLTLSGAAARIAVRDWIEISLEDYRNNIAKWFKEIAIHAYGETRYAPLHLLAMAGQNVKSVNDQTKARIATHLWNAALKNSTPPLWILAAILKRIRFTESSENGEIKDPVTPDRAALIRFILNRNNKNGGIMIKEQNDPNDKSPAIVCGKIFAVMESIQRAAQGKDLNAGIRERFFSFASTSPAPAYGRLMKLSQNHISKLKHDKPGLAVLLDRQLQELCNNIDGFPTIFSLEEQGQFALGYYHQKQQDYDNAKINKELQPLLENQED